MKKILKTLFLCFFAYFNCFSQTRPSSDANTTSSGSCFTCSISSPENARDVSSSTFATFDASTLGIGLIGSISREYDFSANLTQGNNLVFLISFSDNTLLSALGTSVANLTVFDQLKIDLMNGSTVIASYGGNGLSSNMAEVDVIDESTSTYNIIITVPSTNINRVRVNSGAFVALGASPSAMELYDIYSNPADRYYANNFTGNSGQSGAALTACINCFVDRESDAETHNSDPNSNYARMAWDAGLSLLGSEYQYIEYDWGATPDNNFLGDGDGIDDIIVFDMQVSGVADLGLNDLGLGLWNDGGIELVVTYTDFTTETHDNSSSLLSASLLGNKSGRFSMSFEIPPAKTVEKVEIRRVAPTVGLYTELRLYSVHSEPKDPPLPIQLVDFRGEKTTHGILISWSTVYEENNDYFTLLKSLDGETFYSLGTINGAGNSNNQKTYSFQAPLESSSGLSYYKLQQTDFDGTSTTSNLIAISHIEQETVSMQISPNPANNWIEIHINTGEKITSYQITDLNGKSIRMENNNIQGNNRINISALHQGLYNLTINTKNTVLHKRFIKN